MKSFNEWLILREMGFGPYIGPCVETPNFIVAGACSDQKTDAENRKVSNGHYRHRKSKKVR
jgi:hypothetical protein